MREPLLNDAVNVGAIEERAPKEAGREGLPTAEDSMAMNVSAFKAEEPWVGHEPYSRMVDINNRAVPEAVQKASQKEKSFKLKMEGAPTSTQSLCVFTDNSIRTAKYTIVSFFPLALMHQFTRNVANQYFLAVYALCSGPPGRLSALAWHFPP